MLHNEIYPTSDGNFTVIGLYPFGIPEAMRSWIQNNKTEHAILRKHRNAFYLSAFGKLPLLPGPFIEWIVYPVSE